MSTRDQVLALHRAARAELRDGMAAINRVNRQTMSYIGPAPEDEDELEADAEVERLHTEVARQESIIADLQEALTKIAEIAGDYGDGAPDDHYLAHILLQLEGIATSALDEARGTHKKALEAMQKRQQP